MNSKETKPELQQGSSEPVPVFCSQRWILSYIGFLGFGVVYSLRVNISVAIVCMVKSLNSTSNIIADNVTDPSCAAAFETIDKSSERAEFDWSQTTRSTLLASFFYGYIVTQIPGGWLADRYGGKRVLGGALLLSSVATLVLPEAARFSLVLVYAIRVLLGLATGVSFPAMHAMWGRWAPPLERSKLTTLCYAGTTLGNVATFTTSGLLCAYGFDSGWGSIFYITGACGIIWCIAWFYITASSPSVHPRISEVERKYISSTIEFRTDEKNKRVPWLQIAKSPAVYACVTAHVCNNWTGYTLLTGLPTFMKEVLKYDIKQNGALSAVPYICQFVSAILSGQFADLLRTKQILSTTSTRKTFQIASFIGAGTCLVVAGFMSCENRVSVVVLLSAAIMFQGLSRAGYLVNHIDFAPKYAGVLFGITNTMATIPGMVAPIVAGALTPNNSQEEWRNVFYVCAAFLGLGILVFGAFASGELQDWAKDPTIEMEIPSEKEHIGKEAKVSIQQNSFVNETYKIGSPDE